MNILKKKNGKYSRQAIVSLFIAGLGIVETNLHLLQGILGEYYGLSYIAMAVLMYYLRYITTEPLAIKK